MLSRIDVAFAQVADKQPFAAEDVEGQKAKVVVITVKVAPLLKSVYSIVGTVKIQNQFVRGRLEAVDELFEEHLVHQPGFFASSPIL